MDVSKKIVEAINGIQEAKSKEVVDGGELLAQLHLSAMINTEDRGPVLATELGHIISYLSAQREKHMSDLSFCVSLESLVLAILLPPLLQDTQVLFRERYIRNCEPVLSGVNLIKKDCTREGVPLLMLELSAIESLIAIRKVIPDVFHWIDSEDMSDEKREKMDGILRSFVAPLVPQRPNTLKTILVTLGLIPHFIRKVGEGKFNYTATEEGHRKAVDDPIITPHYDMDDAEFLTRIKYGAMEWMVDSLPPFSSSEAVERRLITIRDSSGYECEEIEDYMQCMDRLMIQHRLGGLPMLIQNYLDFGKIGIKIEEGRV